MKYHAYKVSATGNEKDGWKIRAENSVGLLDLPRNRHDPRIDSFMREEGYQPLAYGVEVQS